MKHNRGLTAAMARAIAIAEVCMPIPAFIGCSGGPMLERDRLIDEEVKFASDDGRISLAGTLTVPASGSPHPAAILLAGSGPMDRDGSFLGHMPLKRIAESLATRGIAVLRYDKRGVGGSDGDASTATINDSIDDARSAFRMLSRRDDIDHRCIGLLGHSEGGVVAAGVATREDKAAFVALLASPSVPIAENAALVFSALINECNPDSERIERDRVRLMPLFNTMAGAEEPGMTQHAMVSIAEDLLHRMDSKTRETMGMAQVTPEVFVRMFSEAPPLAAFLRTDPSVHLSRLACPVLGIYGEKDVQVPPSANSAELHHVLSASRGADFTIVGIPNANHLFQQCSSGYPSAYAEAGQTMECQVLEVVGDWMERVVVHQTTTQP